MNTHQTEPLIRTEARGAVLRMIMNRPAARNALSEGLMAALQEALDAAAVEKSVRAIVLAAEGPAFCAGHDLKEMTACRANADKGQAAFAALFAQCSHLMQTIVRHPKPVIAEVQGIATAAGCQLVASCDLAVASSSARFATPGVNLGLFCSTPMVALSRNVARKHAMEMLLTGEMIDAAHAARIGLINRAVAPGEERAAALALAKTIASKSSYVLKIGKEAFYRQAEMGLADAYRYTAEVMTENMMARDAEEGICAFIEKRKATWEDR